jgi:hypothetical protein
LDLVISRQKAAKYAVTFANLTAYAIETINCTKLQIGMSTRLVGVYYVAKTDANSLFYSADRRR